MKLDAFIEALKKRENHWRNLQKDDYQIATAVMVALAEVREAAMEAEPREGEPITAEDLRPPRDIYNPQNKL